MIVVTILGILVSIALPAYNTYSNRSKFAEAALGCITIKARNRRCNTNKKPININSINGGVLGISPNTIATSTKHGINVTNGLITITWKSDGTPLNGVTYTLQANGVTPPIKWTKSGTCLAAGFC